MTGWGHAATPETVALGALGRRATVRPGGLAKFLGWSLAMLSRRSRVRAMGVIMKDMIGKDAARGTAQGANASTTGG